MWTWVYLDFWAPGWILVFSSCSPSSALKAKSTEVCESLIRIHRGSPMNAQTFPEGVEILGGSTPQRLSRNDNNWAPCGCSAHQTLLRSFRVNGAAQEYTYLLTYQARGEVFFSTCDEGVILLL
ncbi:hypothetical protein B0H11DRAFT_2275103, partial [Mycena galericulata]